MGLGYFYRGTKTRNLYSFTQPLLDVDGHQAVGGQFSIALYNGILFPQGEIVVYANRDGSVAMPTAGPGMQVPSSQANIGNVTLPTVTPSPWEMVVEEGEPVQGPTLPTGLPIIP